MANTGPIGTPQSWGRVFLLSLVTLGIYGLIWTYKTFEEIKEHRGEGLGGAMGLVVSLFGVGIFLLPMEIQKMYEGDGKKSPVSAASGFLAFLLYFPWLIKVQGSLNDYWTSKGAPAPA